MNKTVEIRILIDDSLEKYFEEGMLRRHYEGATAEELTDFLALILNELSYPIEAKKSGEQEITLGYRSKSFADPIF